MARSGVPMSARREELPYLQILRGIAALIVATSHSVEDVALLTPGTARLPAISGPFGVEIFFVISGFIICHISWGQFQKPGAWLHFAKNRFVRLVPLCWLFTAVFLLMGQVLPGAVHHNALSVSAVVGSLLFLPIGDASHIAAPVFMNWSLDFEVLFYALFTPLLLLSRQKALAILTLIFTSAILLHPLFEVNTAPEFWSRYYVGEFLTGVWLAALFNWRPSWRMTPRLFWPVTAGLLAFAAFAFPWEYVRHTAVEQLAPALVAPWFVVAAVFLRPGSLSWGSRLLKVVGDASYSLYLTHVFTLRAIRLILQKLHLDNALPAPVYVVLIVTACAGVAVLSYRLIERPLLNLGRRLLFTTPQSTASTPRKAGASANRAA